MDIRTVIAKPTDETIWPKAIELLVQRLDTRYFRPIQKILHMRISTGEGFAVMTLICSLVEFLQTCYEGKTYQYRAKETDFVYGDSGTKFKSFLLQHEPFKSIFNKPVTNQTKYENFAEDFYLNVRCGLLHEASTKNNWVIKIDKVCATKSFVDVSNEKI